MRMSPQDVASPADPAGGRRTGKIGARYSDGVLHMSIAQREEAARNRRKIKADGGGLQRRERRGPGRPVRPPGPRLHPPPAPWTSAGAAVPAAGARRPLDWR
jgi:hypothetical protein